MITRIQKRKLDECNQQDTIINDNSKKVKKGKQNQLDKKINYVPVWRRYLDNFKDILNLEYNSHNEIFWYLLQNAKDDSFRFNIKYEATFTKRVCNYCGLNRKCDHILIVSEREYYFTDDDEFIEKEGEYEIVNKFNIGNYCIEKIIILKEISNLIYKMKYLEEEEDFSSNEFKEYDLCQLIADYDYNVQELEKTKIQIAKKCTNKEVSSNNYDVIV